MDTHWYKPNQANFFPTKKVHWKMKPEYFLQHEKQLLEHQISFCDRKYN